MIRGLEAVGLAYDVKKPAPIQAAAADEPSLLDLEPSIEGSTA
jgi:hypothetical protein